VHISHGINIVIWLIGLVLPSKACVSNSLSNLTYNNHNVCLENHLQMGIDRDILFTHPLNSASRVG
jgi:hypothetical protein